MLTRTWESVGGRLELSVVSDGAAMGSGPVAAALAESRLQGDLGRLLGVRVDVVPADTLRPRLGP